ncbi:MurR/RpiR family transcriptional regulator [Lactobacillus kefiranofaciens]|uniref:MurR/RpiR family transcriptional regulator n=1 Tax=Lactobacillus kefiranofaciens TaxID=267818 RepID=UPI0024689B48|nr:MurR/RpiR family transcriptional regulator [Lactobacillus kefiranofaciens]MDH5099870.1 MurR/RpiR family transcriptional regulator [Lactobacillus kefiranofaciens]
MADLRSMVYDNSNKLNDSEKQIVQFVLNNPKDCSRLSLAKLAKKLYVSESAIFRLCKKLGLSGYSELKFDLIELAQSRQKPIKIENNFARELSRVNDDVLKYFKQRDFNSLYRELENAGTVYIYSTGWQQELIAQYLAHELFVVGKHATVLPSALDELKAASRFAKKGDVLFIISFTGNNKMINEEITKLELVNDKFRYVSFTNMKQNKLASLVQHNIYFPTIAFTDDADYKSGKVAFTPAYYLIDLLISEYVAWQQSQGEDVEINVGN